MEKKNRRGLPCPGRPKKIKGSRLVSGRSGRRRLLPAAFSAARFAPRPPQSLAASFRGAKSSQRFRAAAYLRRPFQRRDLLPAPSKALLLRSGEQNLHRSSAPPSASGGFFSGAICSPPPAKPCGFVWGAKSSQKFRAGACHRRLLLALSRRQTLISPSGHANRAPKIPPGGRPCWRCPAGKRLYHRRATPTGRPGYDEKEKDCRYLSILKSMEQVSAV